MTKFYKISFARFAHDMQNFSLNEESLKYIYDNISMPKIETKV